MHVVAAKPQYLSTNDVPADVLDKEREMIQKQIAEQEEKDSNDSNKKKKISEECHYTEGGMQI